jgi:Zn-dependent peptidase ImmA (M78 family)
LAYRAIEGITQEELAGTLGVTQQLVSAIERDLRSCSADLGLIGYRDDRFELPTMSKPLHRHRASTLTAAKDRAKELLRLGGEVFGELSSITSRAPKHQLTRNIGVLTSFEAIDDAAADLRATLAIDDDGPIKDLTGRIERAGVCIIPMTGLTGIDGISAWVGETPVIGISPSMPGDRFRLTLGHELAHLIHHDRSSAFCESEANRFASTLLFPTERFLDAVDDTLNLSHYVSLKSAWGVSVAALVYRAHDEGIIDDKRYRALQIQMSRWRKNEPGRFEPSVGQLLPKLIEVNGGIPAVSAKLGLNAQHLRELVTWSHLRLAAGAVDRGQSSGAASGSGDGGKRPVVLHVTPDE